MNNVKRGYRFAIALLVLALVITAVLPFVLPSSTPDAAYANSYTSSYTGTYYDGIDPTLTGSAMRSQLEKLITSTHKKLTSYDELKSIYGQTDIDPSTGKLVLFYTGTQVSSYSSYGANREHVWPKDAGKAFPASSQAGSDAHHLRPCDQQLNSTRGSLSFGETTAKVAKQGGSTTYGNLCYTGGGFFYPGKGFRGATARILMYVQTRWGTQFSLKFVDGAGKCKTIGDFDTLYKWHLEEPPSELEIYRNEQVAKIQGNRNPFIDHPEYAYQIYSVNSLDYYSSGDDTQLANSVKSLTANNDVYGNLNEVDAESITLNVNSLSLSVGQTYQASVRAYPAGASNAVNWNSSNDSVVSVSSAGVLTAKAQGTATITATSKSKPSLTATMTVTVTEQQHGSDEDKVTAFKNSVKNISAGGAEAKFEDIKHALTLYGELTNAQKTEVQTEYEQLKLIVSEYNQSANEANQTITNSLADVVTGFSVVLPVLLALIALLKSVIK